MADQHNKHLLMIEKNAVTMRHPFDLFAVDPQHSEEHHHLVMIVVARTYILMTVQPKTSKMLLIQRHKGKSIVPR
jgi:hypothetical protein